MPGWIADPDAYVRGVPHERFDQLRRREPVTWVELDDEPGYWAVLRHADVVHVAKHSEIFSATEGGVIVENLDKVALANMRDMLLAMDPPRHTAYRKPVAPEFRARVIAGLEDRVRTITREILDETAALGPKLEFVHDVCAKLPSRVLGQLMGLPDDDLPTIHALAERNSGGQDPDLADPGERGSSSVEMAMYAMQFAATRRETPPQGDLTDLLLRETFGGSPMTDVDFARFFVQLVTAGNDTTRTMLSSGMLALLEHPDQLAQVRHDPSVIPTAVEEMLRWANPLHYFRRTAVAEATLGGVRIAAGDKVAMVYTAANRDPEIFTDPHRFDVGRSPNPHLSFGIATHFCLGVHIARLEGRVFFEEALGRWIHIELAGAPTRQRSNLNNALKTLPVHVA
ncbi:MAG: cytochrome P450 [Actinomycetota bacterium]